MFTQNATGGLASMPGQPEFHHPPIIEPEMDCEPAEPDKVAVDSDPTELSPAQTVDVGVRLPYPIVQVELGEPGTDAEADANADSEAEGPGPAGAEEPAMAEPETAASTSPDGVDDSPKGTEG